MRAHTDLKLCLILMIFSGLVFQVGAQEFSPQTLDSQQSLEVSNVENNTGWRNVTFTENMDSGETVTLPFNEDFDGFNDADSELERFLAPSRLFDFEGRQDYGNDLDVRGRSFDGVNWLRRENGEIVWELQSSKEQGDEYRLGTGLRLTSLNDQSFDFRVEENHPELGDKPGELRFSVEGSEALDKELGVSTDNIPESVVFDGDNIFVGDQDSVITKYTSLGEQVDSFDHGGGEITGLAAGESSIYFSSEDGTLASLSKDLSNFEEYNVGSGPANDVAVNDSHVFAAFGEDEALSIEKGVFSDEKYVYGTDDGSGGADPTEFLSVTVDEQGNAYFSTAEDGTGGYQGVDSGVVRILSTAEGELENEGEDYTVEFEDGDVLDVALSENNQYLFSGSTEGSIWRIDADTGDNNQQILNEASVINSVETDPQNFVYAGTGDGDIWKGEEDGTEQNSIQVTDSVNDLAVNEPGYLLSIDDSLELTRFVRSTLQDPQIEVETSEVFSETGDFTASETSEDFTDLITDGDNIGESSASSSSVIGLSFDYNRELPRTYQETVLQQSSTVFSNGGDTDRDSNVSQDLENTFSDIGGYSTDKSEDQDARLESGDVDRAGYLDKVVEGFELAIVQEDRLFMLEEELMQLEVVTESQTLLVLNQEEDSGLLLDLQNAEQAWRNQSVDEEVTVLLDRESERYSEYGAEVTVDVEKLLTGQTELEFTGEEDIMIEEASPALLEAFQESNESFEVETSMNDNFELLEDREALLVTSPGSDSSLDFGFEQTEETVISQASESMIFLTDMYSISPEVRPAHGSDMKVFESPSTSALTASSVSSPLLGYKSVLNQDLALRSDPESGIFQRELNTLKMLVSMLQGEQIETQEAQEFRIVSELEQNTEMMVQDSEELSTMLGTDTLELASRASENIEKIRTSATAEDQAVFGEKEFINSFIGLEQGDELEAYSEEFEGVEIDTESGNKMVGFDQEVLEIVTDTDQSDVIVLDTRQDFMYGIETEEFSETERELISQETLALSVNENGELEAFDSEEVNLILEEASSDDLGLEERPSQKVVLVDGFDSQSVLDQVESEDLIAEQQLETLSVLSEDRSMILVGESDSDEVLDLSQILVQNTLTEYEVSSEIDGSTQVSQILEVDESGDAFSQVFNQITEGFDVSEEGSSQIETVETRDQFFEVRQDTGNTGRFFESAAENPDIIGDAGSTTGLMIDQAFGIVSAPSTFSTRSSSPILGVSPELVQSSFDSTRISRLLEENTVIETDQSNSVTLSEENFQTVQIDSQESADIIVFEDEALDFEIQTFTSESVIIDFDKGLSAGVLTEQLDESKFSDLTEQSTMMLVNQEGEIETLEANEEQIITREGVEDGLTLMNEANSSIVFLTGSENQLGLEDMRSESLGISQQLETIRITEEGRSITVIGAIGSESVLGLNQIFSQSLSVTDSTGTEIDLNRLAGGAYTVSSGGSSGLEIFEDLQEDASVTVEQRDAAELEFEEHQTLSTEQEIITGLEAISSPQQNIRLTSSQQTDIATMAENHEAFSVSSGPNGRTTLVNRDELGVAVEASGSNLAFLNEETDELVFLEMAAEETVSLTDLQDLDASILGISGSESGLNVDRSTEFVVTEEGEDRLDLNEAGSTGVTVFGSVENQAELDQVIDERFIVVEEFETQSVRLEDEDMNIVTEIGATPTRTLTENIVQAGFSMSNSLIDSFTGSQTLEQRTLTETDQDLGLSALEHSFEQAFLEADSLNQIRGVENGLTGISIQNMQSDTSALRPERVLRPRMGEDTATQGDFQRIAQDNLRISQDAESRTVIQEMQNVYITGSAFSSSSLMATQALETDIAMIGVLESFIQIEDSVSTTLVGGLNQEEALIMGSEQLESVEVQTDQGSEIFVLDQHFADIGLDKAVSDTVVIESESNLAAGINAESMSENRLNQLIEQSTVLLVDSENRLRGLDTQEQELAVSGNTEELLDLFDQQQAEMVLIKDSDSELDISQIESENLNALQETESARITSENRSVTLIGQTGSQNILGLRQAISQSTEIESGAESGIFTFDTVENSFEVLSDSSGLIESFETLVQGTDVSVNQEDITTINSDAIQTVAVDEETSSEIEALDSIHQIAELSERSQHTLSAFFKHSQNFVTVPDTDSTTNIVQTEVLAPVLEMEESSFVVLDQAEEELIYIGTGQAEEADLERLAGADLSLVDLSEPVADRGLDVQEMPEIQSSEINQLDLNDIQQQGLVLSATVETESELERILEADFDIEGRTSMESAYMEDSDFRLFIEEDVDGDTLMSELFEEAPNTATGSSTTGSFYSSPGLDPSTAFSSSSSINILSSRPLEFTTSAMVSPTRTVSRFLDFAPEILFDGSSEIDTRQDVSDSVHVSSGTSSTVNLSSENMETLRVETDQREKAYIVEEQVLDFNLEFFHSETVYVNADTGAAVGINTDSMNQAELNQVLQQTTPLLIDRDRRTQVMESVDQEALLSDIAEDELEIEESSDISIVFLDDTGSSLGLEDVQNEVLGIRHQFETLRLVEEDNEVTVIGSANSRSILGLQQLVAESVSTSGSVSSQGALKQVISDTVYMDSTSSSLIEVFEGVFEGVNAEIDADSISSLNPELEQEVILDDQSVSAIDAASRLEEDAELSTSQQSSIAINALRNEAFIVSPEAQGETLLVDRAVLRPEVESGQSNLAVLNQDEQELVFLESGMEDSSIEMEGLRQVNPSVLDISSPELRAETAQDMDFFVNQNGTSSLNLEQLVNNDLMVFGRVESRTELERALAEDMQVSSISNVESYRLEDADTTVVIGQEAEGFRSLTEIFADQSITVQDGIIDELTSVQTEEQSAEISASRQSIIEIMSTSFENVYVRNEERSQLYAFDEQALIPKMEDFSSSTAVLNSEMEALIEINDEQRDRIGFQDLAETSVPIVVDGSSERTTLQNAELEVLLEGRIDTLADLGFSEDARLLLLQDAGSVSELQQLESQDIGAVQDVDAIYQVEQQGDIIVIGDSEMEYFAELKPLLEQGLETDSGADSGLEVFDSVTGDFSVSASGFGSDLRYLGDASQSIFIQEEGQFLRRVPRTLRQDIVIEENTENLLDAVNEIEQISQISAEDQSSLEALFDTHEEFTMIAEANDVPIYIERNELAVEMEETQTELALFDHENNEVLLVDLEGRSTLETSVLRENGFEVIPVGDGRADRDFELEQSILIEEDDDLLISRPVLAEQDLGIIGEIENRAELDQILDPGLTVESTIDPELVMLDDTEAGIMIESSDQPAASRLRQTLSEIPFMGLDSEDRLFAEHTEIQNIVPLMDLIIADMENAEISPTMDIDQGTHLEADQAVIQALNTGLDVKQVIDIVSEYNQEITIEQEVQDILETSIAVSDDYYILAEEESRTTYIDMADLAFYMESNDEFLITFAQSEEQVVFVDREILAGQQFEQLETTSFNISSRDYPAEGHPYFVPGTDMNIEFGFSTEEEGQYTREPGVDVLAVEDVESLIETGEIAEDDINVLTERDFTRTLFQGAEFSIIHDFHVDRPGYFPRETESLTAAASSSTSSSIVLSQDLKQGILVSDIAARYFDELVVQEFVVEDEGDFVLTRREMVMQELGLDERFESGISITDRILEAPTSSTSSASTRAVSETISLLIDILYDFGFIDDRSPVEDEPEGIDVPEPEVEPGIELETRELELSLTAGQSISEGISGELDSEEAETVDITLSEEGPGEGFDEYATVPQTTYTLDPGQFEIPLDVSVPVEEEPQVVRDEITLEIENQTEETIPVDMVIQSADRELLDVRLDILDEQAVSGQQHPYIVEIFNMGTAQTVDILLDTIVYDETGEEVYRESEEMAVDTSISIARDLRDLEPGEYEVRTVANYDNRTAESSSTMEIVEDIDQIDEPGRISRTANAVMENIEHVLTWLLIFGVIGIYIYLAYLEGLFGKSREERVKQEIEELRSGL